MKLKSVTPKEAMRMIDQGALYVDLRNEAYAAHKVPDIPDIFFMPWEELGKAYDKLPKDRLLILADASGLHCAQAVELLRNKGFDKVTNMGGGFIEWERDGLPVREDITERISGPCPCQLKPRDKK